MSATTANSELLGDVAAGKAAKPPRFTDAQLNAVLVVLQENTGIDGILTSDLTKLLGVSIGRTVWLLRTLVERNEVYSVDDINGRKVWRLVMEGEAIPAPSDAWIARWANGRSQTVVPAAQARPLQLPPTAVRSVFECGRLCK